LHTDQLRIFTAGHGSQKAEQPQNRALPLRLVRECNSEVEESAFNTCWNCRPSSWYRDDVPRASNVTYCLFYFFQKTL
jgi:hypothetical protein